MNDRHKLRMLKEARQFCLDAIVGQLQTYTPTKYYYTRAKTVAWNSSVMSIARGLPRPWKKKRSAPEDGEAKLDYMRGEREARRQFDEAREIGLLWQRVALRAISGMQVDGWVAGAVHAMGTNRDELFDLRPFVKKQGEVGSKEAQDDGI